jgi:quercetin dioxygenase-like cupin family protein
MMAGTDLEAELRRRTIRATDYVSCDEAFIDCRTPGSDRKENYSIIGSGVTQSGDQVVNLTEPHGFQVGAAAMPSGITNSLHLHFTAEVFVNTRGDWRIRWGIDGRDGEFTCLPGDIVSVPTWIFRGFTNVGPADGWLFTVLGFDETGGIVWGPSVLDDARGHGLHLATSGRLVETAPGAPPPPGVEVVAPMADADRVHLRRPTADQMRGRVVTPADLRWSDRPFLCSGLPGGRAEWAAVIGYGMTEDRDQEPPIHNPHNFAVAKLRAAAGEGVLAHRHGVPQALVVTAGRWQVALGGEREGVATEIGFEDTLSVPAHAWRSFTALEDGAEAVVVTGGDARVHLEWAPEVRAAARARGVVRDAGGYVAPLSVVGGATRDD